MQDCLQLLLLLVHDNPANQLMFRESGHLANVHYLLRLPGSAPAAAPSGFQAAAASLEARFEGAGAPPGLLSAEVAANLCNAVDLVCALLSPLSPAAIEPATSGGAEAVRSKMEMAAMCLEANHAVFAKARLHAALLDVALVVGQGAAVDVRCKALQAMRVLVAGRQSAQDTVGNATVTVRGAPTPAVQVCSPRLTEPLYLVTRFRCTRY